MTVLELTDVHAHYGKIHALKGISLNVEKGEIVTLIGGNGAGKSTTLRTISGLMRPTFGSVMFEGEDLQRYKPSQLASRGIAMVPEGRGVFARMTVLENLEMGAYHRKDKAGILEDIERVYELFPRLKERRTQVAGTMSGGEQQMLAMGRAMMSRPPFYCWMNRQWGWRRCWWKRSLARSRTSINRAQPSCWSNKTR
jgi:branched-chain amino acid transport system ATP-binding protein